MVKTKAKKKTRSRKPKAVATKTLLCLIVDSSGSMSNKVDEVVGGINEFIDTHQKTGSDADLIMVEFNSDYSPLRRLSPIDKVEKLSREDYRPRAMTALYDAIGRTIDAISIITHQYDKIITVIVTDGQENSSTRYNQWSVKSMIQASEATGKWAFIYMGAQASTFLDAANLGIKLSNTAYYTGSPIGTRHAYRSMAVATNSLRCSTSGNISLESANLGCKLDENGNKVEDVTKVLTSIVTPTNDKP